MSCGDVGKVEPVRCPGTILGDDLGVRSVKRIHSEPDGDDGGPVEISTLHNEAREEVHRLSGLDVCHIRMQGSKQER